MSTRPEDGYRNQPMSHDEALSLVMDAGCLLSDQYADKHLVPGTARLELKRCDYLKVMLQQILPTTVNVPRC